MAGRGVLVGGRAGDEGEGSGVGVVEVQAQGGGVKETREEMVSRLRLNDSLDRWHWWLRQIAEKYERVPNVRSDIWDKEVLNPRQPVECG
jgi:hypothetical protein